MKPSEILKEIKEDPFKLSGICLSYRTYSKKPLYEVMELKGISFKDWPQFSGFYEFPVPSTNPKMSPVEYFYESKRYQNLWNKRNKYGKARWALLDWLIEQFEAKGA